MLKTKSLFQCQECTCTINFLYKKKSVINGTSTTHNKHVITRGHYYSRNTGCVRLASLGRPGGAHSGEPLTRANGTITLALSW